MSAYVAVHSFPVDEDQDVVVVEAVHLQVSAHIAFVEGKRRTKAAQQVFHATCLVLLQRLAGDDFCLYRCIFQVMLRAGTRDDYLIQLYIQFLPVFGQDTLCIGRLHAT